MRDDSAEHSHHAPHVPHVPSVTMRARLRGLHRGADVSGEVEIVVEERGLRLALADGPVVPVPWAALDGVEQAGASVSLYLMGDEVLELESVGAGGDVDDAVALARLVTERACHLGELTMALRGLGSARARPGSDHQRFYGPLLTARRALEGARSPESQLAAADPERLGGALRATLAAFAKERYPGPKEAADRRALEAELTDYAEGLQGALDRLAEARDAVRAAPGDVRFAMWREWAAALRAVFAEHDRAWIAWLPALCDPRGPQGGFWRRLLGRGKSGGSASLAGALLPLLASLLASSHASAQVADDGVRETVRVTNAGADSLRHHGFDVVFEQRERDRRVPLVVVGRAERERLAREGFAIEPMTRGIEARRRAAIAPGQSLRAVTRVYRDFDDPQRGVRAWLDSMAGALPGFVRVDSVGASWEGRPILAVHVGRAGATTTATDDPARPNVLFVATYHAREWVATEMALRLVRHLATSDDARTRALADTRDVWIVPVVNPDGYEYTFTTDRLWRKNRRPDAFVGVDLNRNHAERWGWDEFGSSRQPAAETYRGPTAASEPEVQAIQALALRVQPVTSISYHSFSGLVLYPPGFADGLLPQDLGTYRALAGTDLAPAVRDHVPGTTIEYYHPGPGWHLYLTNGDYVDWASAHGTLAMTTELTSGCDVDCDEGYYGFEFPDEEALIQRVFLDNLPLALDVIDAAADPAAFTSPTTGLSTPRVTLESASPVVRVRVPATLSASPDVRMVASGHLSALPMRRDSAPSSRVEARFLSSPLGARPASLQFIAPAIDARWLMLLAGGGESGDTGWESAGWASIAVGTPPRAGHAYWESASGDELRSPAVRMPQDADTVVVAWWQQHTLNAAQPGAPGGVVRVSVDGGAPQVVALVGGDARAWYPEQVRLGGVRGRTLRVGFASLGARWRIDEVQLLAENALLPSPTTVASLAVRPSANPVRSPTVTFAWPVDAGAGEIAVYDFGGRRVWRRTVGAGELSATWDTAAQSLANGAYLVVARAGARQSRLTLYVAR